LVSYTKTIPPSIIGSYPIIRPRARKTIIRLNDVTVKIPKLSEIKIEIICIRKISWIKKAPVKNLERIIPNGFVLGLRAQNDPQRYEIPRKVSTKITNPFSSEYPFRKTLTKAINVFTR